MTKFNVQFTASVSTEESAQHGDFAQHGWLNPDWSKTVLWELAEDVPVYTFDTRAEAEAFIDDTIGPADSYDGCDWYAADSHDDYDNGENWTYAGHVTEV